jgi:hypothetical protein
VIRLESGSIAICSMPENPDDPTDDGELLCTVEKLSQLKEFFSGVFGRREGQ